MENAFRMAMQSDEAANLEVVRKAGALALCLELPSHSEAMGTENNTICRGIFTPMPSPVSEWSPEASGKDSLSSPGFCLSGSQSLSGWATASLSPMPKAQKMMSFGSLGSSQAMSPTSPGVAIRSNATNFGIPLSVQSMVGDVVIPLPVRTQSGTVVAPSPMSRVTSSTAPPTFSLPSSTGTVHMMNGNYPFVTPFSAGLRGARGGGA
jgi:hypothetical protein